MSSTLENKPLVKAPTLNELKSRPCSQEELQAALVKLIELHNTLAEKRSARDIVFNI